MRILFLFLIAVPLAEIIAFGLVVQWLGFWLALLLVVATSAMGFLILRHHGFGLAAKMARMARTGIAPESGIGGDAMTMLSGFLLLLPGFLSDILGLLLLLPFVRRLIGGTPIMRTRFHTGGGTTYSESYDFGTGRGGSVVDLDEDEFRRDEAARSADRKDNGRIGPR